LVFKILNKEVTTKYSFSQKEIKGMANFYHKKTLVNFIACCGNGNLNFKHFHYKPSNFLNKTKVVGEFVELEMVLKCCALSHFYAKPNTFLVF
jgi:hypothetical protein